MNRIHIARNTRFTAFLLAAFMLVIMLAGCSGGDSTTVGGTTGGSTTSNTTTGGTTSSAGKPSAYGTVAPEDQLDYINYDSAVPIVKEGQEVNLTFGVMLEPGFTNNVAENWLWEFVEDQLNIIPEVQEILDEEKLSLLFASNQVPDIFLDVTFKPEDIVKYGVSEKQLLAYDDYLDGYMPSLKAYYESDPKAVINRIASDGKMYSYPRTLNDTTIVGSYIRKEWLDQLDLETPTTLDEFNATMIAFRDAGPEALGVDRVIPIGGGYEGWANPGGVLMEAMGFQFNPYWKGWQAAAGYIPCQRVGADGVAYYGLPVMDELFVEALTVQNMWYEEALLSPEYFTQDAAQARADATAGYTGWQNTTEGVAAYEGGLGSVAAWRTLAPLTSTWNDVPVSVNYNIYNITPYMIGGNTEYPEVSSRFIDLMFHPEWDYVVQKGPIEGIHSTYGYKGYSWGKDANGNDAIVVEGEENATTYRNANLVPTYMDHGIVNTFAAQARWKSAVAGQTIEPDSKEAIVERYKKLYAEDPVKYKNYPFYIETYDARGAYSESGVDPILTTVYRDEATNQKIADLDAILSPYVKEQVALFIAGKRPLDEVQAFQEELRSMGIDEYQAILKQEYEDYMAKLK